MVVEVKLVVLVVVVEVKLVVLVVVVEVKLVVLVVVVEVELEPRSIKTDSFTVRFRTWSQNGTFTAVNKPYLSVISGTVLRRRISTLIRLLYGYLRI